MSEPLSARSWTRVVKAAGHLRRAFVVAASTVSFACYGYQSVKTAPSPGADVRLTLKSASTIFTSASTPSASPNERVAREGVFEVSGTLMAASGDTLVVRLGTLSTSRGAIGGVSNHVALIPADRIASIQERRFQAGLTLLGGVGLVFVATAVLLTILIVALTKIPA